MTVLIASGESGMSGFPMACINSRMSHVVHAVAKKRMLRFMAYMKWSLDDAAACAFAPVTPAKGFRGAGPQAPQPARMFHSQSANPFERLEPFNIVKVLCGHGSRLACLLLQGLHASCIGPQLLVIFPVAPCSERPGPMLEFCGALACDALASTLSSLQL